MLRSILLSLPHLPPPSLPPPLPFPSPVPPPPFLPSPPAKISTSPAAHAEPQDGTDRPPSPCPSPPCPSPPSPSSASHTPRASLTSLPCDILAQIAALLPHTDRLSLSLSHRVLRAHLAPSNTPLWRDVYRLRYAARPHPPPPHLLPAPSHAAVALRDLADDYHLHAASPLRPLHTEGHAPAQIAFSHPTLYVAAGTAFSVHHRHARRDTWTRLAAHETDPVTAMHASEHGLVAGFANHSVALYDPTARAFARMMKGHRGAVTAVARVGDLIVSGSADKTLRLRSASTRRGLAVLRGHDGAVRWVAQGNGPTVLSHGGADGRVKLWDLERCACVSTGRVAAPVVQAAVAGRGPERETVYVASGRCVNVLDARMGLGRTAAVLSLPRGRRWSGAGDLRALALGGAGRVAAAVGAAVCVWEGRGGWEGVGLGVPGRWRARSGAAALRALLVGGRSVVAGGAARELLVFAVDGSHDGVVADLGAHCGGVHALQDVGEPGFLVARGDARVEWADVAAARNDWVTAAALSRGEIHGFWKDGPR